MEDEDSSIVNSDDGSAVEAKPYSAVAPAQVKDWMELSKEYGLSIFERQPEETNIEWQIWITYRDHYPMKIPKWSELAVESGHAINTVLKASQRWNFNTRLQAWARYMDDTMSEDRAKNIQEMNSRHLSMAQQLQQKLADAVDLIDPALLKPNEIANLAKFATEMERKIVVGEPEKVLGTVESTGGKQDKLTKPEDIGSIVEILRSTGLLDGKTIGIEAKTTTRLIAKEEDLKDDT